MIDQFITSGEVKWGRVSGLAMMLPHGYEGQGPEHSSARPERFLQLCADNNMQVVQPTTPAQVFHLLRRQMIRLFRKPLRDPDAEVAACVTRKPVSRRCTTSPRGGFQTVHRRRRPTLDPKKVKRVIVCSGKVYYELRTARRRARATRRSCASSSCIRSRTRRSRPS